MRLSRAFSDTLFRVRQEGRDLTKAEKNDVCSEGAFGNTTIEVEWDKAGMDAVTIGGDYCLSMHQFRNGHRCKEEWVGCDILMFDYDGDEGQPSMDSVIAGLQGLGYYIHYSNSYVVTMPRPKWHCFLRLSRTVTDMALYKAIHKKLRETLFIGSDIRVGDVGRACIPGTPRFDSIFSDGLAVDVDALENAIIADMVKDTAEALKIQRDGYKEQKEKLSKRGENTSKAHIYINLDTKVVLGDKKTRKALRELDPSNGVACFCPACGFDADRHNPGATNASYIFNSGSFKTPCVYCFSEGIAYEVALDEAYEAGKATYDKTFEHLFFIESQLCAMRTTEETMYVAKADPEMEFYGLPEPLAKAIRASIYRRYNNSTELFQFCRVPSMDVTTPQFKLKEGDSNCLLGLVPAIAPNIDDPAFIEKWLLDTFREERRVRFMKELMASYCYSNFDAYPVVVLFGPRGGGKNLISNVFGNMFFKMLGEAEPGQSWTDALSKKCVVYNENKALNRDLYTEIKLLTGSKDTIINNKFGLKYTRPANNLFFINSNEEMPFVTCESERAKYEGANQFFMHRMETVPEHKVDKHMEEKILDRIGWYMRKELKVVWDELCSRPTTGRRYSIEVPMTEEYHKIFDLSTTTVEDDVTEFWDWLCEGGIYKDFKGDEHKIEFEESGAHIYLKPTSINKVLPFLHLQIGSKKLRDGLKIRGHMASKETRNMETRLGFEVFLDQGRFVNVLPSKDRIYR